MSNYLDLNDAPAQKDGVRGPIPPDSVVIVRMEIRQPTTDMQVTPQDVWLTRSKRSENHYLDCKFTVISPTHEGKPIWQNYCMMGSETACNISRSFLRAVIESAHGIMPDDASERATQQRRVQDFSVFNGLEFPVMVGIKDIRHGDKYVNNEILKAITPDMDAYKVVQEHGEILTDKPVPELPPLSASQAGPMRGTTAAQDGMPQSPARKWGAPQ